MIEIRKTTVYRGPNIWARMPVILMVVDIGELEDRPTNKIPGFYERLTEIHAVALRPRLLARPTGRIPAADARGNVDGPRAGARRARAAEPGRRRGIARQDARHRRARRLQRRLRLRSGRRRARRGQARRAACSTTSSTTPSRISTSSGRAGRERHPASPSGSPTVPRPAAIVSEAERRGIPVLRLDPRRARWSSSATASTRSASGPPSRRRTSNIAVDVAGEQGADQPPPAGGRHPRAARGRSCATSTTRSAAARRIGYPVVLKPLDGNHGRGVCINLRRRSRGARVLPVAEGESRDGHGRGRDAIITGKDYRILVVNEQVVAVAERVPAHVVGDGTHTVAAVGRDHQRRSRRGIGHEKILTRISVDEPDARDAGAAGDRRSTTCRRTGSVVQLKQTGNMSTGGTSIDRTDDIHPDNVEIARQAAMVVGLDVAGIDFIAADIARSVRRERRRDRRGQRRPRLPHAHPPDRGPSAPRRPRGDRHALPARQPIPRADRGGHRHERQDDDRRA